MADEVISHSVSALYFTFRRVARDTARYLWGFLSFVDLLVHLSFNGSTAIAVDPVPYARQTIRVYVFLVSNGDAIRFKIPTLDFGAQYSLLPESLVKIRHRHLVQDYINRVPT